MANKFMSLWMAPDRTARARSMLEIRANQLLWNARPRAALKLSDAAGVLPAALAQWIESNEADESVRYVRALFDQMSQRTGLPFPHIFNADRSLAKLIYACTRCARPNHVVECGVGYGISSALMLLAMQRNDLGELHSLDLPSLSDALGAHVGAVVPSELRTRWTLKLGDSRTNLPAMFTSASIVDFFVSDSANVFTLQRFEFEHALPALSASGMMIFNNVSQRFTGYVAGRGEVEAHAFWQEEKPGAVTLLVLKR